METNLKENEVLFMGYIVRNNGEILTKDRSRLMKQELTIKNLYRVTLSEYGITKRFYVHKLIWVLFCNGCFTDIVSHIDGVQTNNVDYNLQLHQPTRRKKYV